MQKIPCLNLRDYTLPCKRRDKDSFVAKLGTTFETFGFLRLRHHDVPQNTIDAAYKEVKAFFALPREVKQQYITGVGGQRGFTSFGKEHAKDAKVGDLKEFFHVGPTLMSELRAKHGYADNVAVTEVPLLLPRCVELFSELNCVAYSMLQAICDYFSIANDDLPMSIVEGNSILRALHYPPLLPGPPRHVNAVRAAAHEDINLITFLCEATGPGLEVLTRQGDWIPVDALDGELVVNVGDMLARITNNVFPSTTHRVVNPPDEDSAVPRFSMPFFVHPHSTYELKAWDICNEKGDALPPITAGDYLQQRLREIGLVK